MPISRKRCRLGACNRVKTSVLVVRARIEKRYALKGAFVFAALPFQMPGSSCQSAKAESETCADALQ